MYFCIEILDHRRESAAHPQKRPNLTKNAAKSAIFAQFGPFVRKIVIFGHFWAKQQSLPKHLPVQRRIHVIFWKKRLSGRVMGAYFRGLAAKTARNGQLLRY